MKVLKVFLECIWISFCLLKEYICEKINPKPKPDFLPDQLTFELTSIFDAYGMSWVKGDIVEPNSVAKREVSITFFEDQGGIIPDGAGCYKGMMINSLEERMPHTLMLSFHPKTLDHLNLYMRNLNPIYVGAGGIKPSAPKGVRLEVNLAKKSDFVSYKTQMVTDFKIIPVYEGSADFTEITLH